MLIKGRTITLFEKNKNGTNAFGEPVFSEEEVQVQNVLIEPTSAEDVVTEEQLYGRHSSFTLHIPKGDSHNWINCEVVLGAEFGQKRYRQFGDIKTYQEELLPLAWGKKVMVEDYE